MPVSKYLTAVPLALAALASAANDPGPFSIFAYGPGIGGLPLFFSGGDVFAGNFSRVNSSDTAPIQFSVEDGAWLGSPNKTNPNSGRNATWSNYTFAVPGPSSSSHTVKLVNGTADDDYVSDLLFYGSFVLLQSSSGFTSLWYAATTDDEGVYNIGWNATAIGTSDDKVAVTLKSTPPSG
ncbi:hypothetical protein ACHAPU_011107 [Fusarium lateritium]